VKQPIRQPKQSKKAKRAAAKAAQRRRLPERSGGSSFEALVRLDRSAVLTAILFYCVIHWMIRTFIAPVYTVEEANQLLFSQSLRAWIRSPPAADAGLAARFRRRWAALPRHRLRREIRAAVRRR
jgi:hypothetical protein